MNHFIGAGFGSRHGRSAGIGEEIENPDGGIGFFFRVPDRFHDKIPVGRLFRK